MSKRAPAVSIWSPLKERWFAALWTASLVSNVGSWMNDVAAAWYMTELSTSPFLISLVQAATTLPVFLMALPAGALADIANRRHYLLSIQTGLIVVGIAFAVCAFAGWIGPWTLVAFVFFLGIGNALTLPAWQAIVPDLVAKERLSMAIALNGVNINLARAIGPAIGGFLVAMAGPAWVFALNAVSFILIVGVLFAWPYRKKASSSPPEDVAAAAIAGLRFVFHSPGYCRVLLRIGAFMIGASALWALLPLLARTQLGLDATGYGFLMAALGAGAVLSAFLLPHIRRTLSTSWLLALGTVGFALITGLFCLIKSPWVAMGASLLAGSCWLLLLSTYNGLAQAYLPAWVRARGLSVYLIVFFGGLSAGSLIWGAIASFLDLQLTLALAGGLQVFGLLATFKLKLDPPDRECLEPAQNWRVHAFDVPAEPGQAILVHKLYHVSSKHIEEFKAMMKKMRLIRLRDGAIGWSLYRDPDNPTHYTESFQHPSWSHHQRSHERFTREDKALESKIARCLESGEPPRLAHYFRVE